ncbi:MAG: beta-ketoacyl-ACP synthase II [Myxococcota bacterium]|jgi:3-oxoacyl-[acyl-carrier-protein] synthase II|nr:beta-ketoacyl-ACP synthase II [Myxococcota bacterium]
MGCVSPLGLDVSSLWNGLMSCKSGIAPITRFDTTGFATTFAAEVKDFNPEQWIPRREVRTIDRFIQLSIAAGDEAMQDAGLSKFEDPMSHRVGTLVGVGLGGLATIEETYTVLREKGPRRISPYFIPGIISNLAPGQLSIRFNAKGPCVTTTTACASAAHAMGGAMRLLQYGDCDIVIAGGAESVITPLGIGGFNALKALSTRNDDPSHASRPFDKNRDGFVIGEGAAILILEELEHAKKRGARIYAELTGYGATADANHITAPAPGGEGAVRCMKQCLQSAGLDRGDVQYVNAHGTSTPINDPLETQALKTVFGDHASQLAVSSTKSMHGHLLGAAAAIEAVATIKAIELQVAPPTANYEEKDPECDLDYVPNEPRPMTIRHALSNSLGFGGTNATLVFSRFEG